MEKKEIFREILKERLLNQELMKVESIVARKERREKREEEKQALINLRNMVISSREEKQEGRGFRL